eukprot:2935758-Rhodomonas_salina.1
MRSAAAAAVRGAESRSRRDALREVEVERDGLSGRVGELLGRVGDLQLERDRLSSGRVLLQGH